MSEEKTTLTVTIKETTSSDEVKAIETAIEETLKLDDKEVKVKERKPRKPKETKDANKTEKPVDDILQERELTYISEPEAWSELPWDILSISAYHIGHQTDAETAIKEAIKINPHDSRLQQNALIILH